MGRGRQDDHSETVKLDAHCVDCDTDFTVTVYAGTDPQESFPRDHPQNGCHVKERKAVRLKRSKK